MVRTDGKKNLSSVTDLKAVRIERNLKRLTELANSSHETKQRTLEYINMAKTNAERQAEYKAKAKQSKKQLNYFISELAYQSLTDLAAEQGKAKIDVLESLLLGNIQLPSNNIEKENLQRDIFNMNRRNEALSAELRTAKAKILELKNTPPEPEQQQRETSAPLNLIPDKVFKYDYYGSERLIALLPDDSRLFFKDTGKRWELFINANSGHFSEKEGRFYFGKTEIFPVENFKGKLPKTLVMR